MGLYKYIPPQRLDILRNGYIRFTPIAALCDPLPLDEAAYHLPRTPLRSISAAEIDAELNQQYQALPEHIRSMLSLEYFIRQAKDRRQEIAQQLQERHTSQGVQSLAPRLAAFQHLGVLSLSATATSPVMWAQYAQNHSGLVLSFNQAHPFFHRHQGDALPPLRPVLYGHDSDAVPSQFDLLFTKPECWAHEEEWRLLKPLDQAHKTLGPDNNVHVFKIPPAAIDGIIFGCRMPVATQQKLANLILTDMRYKRLTLQRCLLDPGHRELVLAPYPVPSD